MLGLLFHVYDVTGTESGFAGVIVVLISIGAAHVTARASSKAAVKSTQITTRGDIEKLAFERAEGYYTRAMERQDKQIEDLEQDLATEKRDRAAETGQLRTELNKVKGELADAQREIVRLNTDRATP